MEIHTDFDGARVVRSYDNDNGFSVRCMKKLQKNRGSVKYSIRFILLALAVAALLT
jgi:hypothetical protein